MSFGEIFGFKSIGINIVCFIRSCQTISATLLAKQLVRSSPMGYQKTKFGVVSSPIKH